MGDFRGSHRKSYHLTSVLWECSHSQVPRQERECLPPFLSSPSPLYPCQKCQGLTGAKMVEERAKLNLHHEGWNDMSGGGRMFCSSFCGIHNMHHSCPTAKGNYGQNILPNQICLSFATLTCSSGTRRILSLNLTASAFCQWGLSKRKRRGKTEWVWDCGKEGGRGSMFSSAEGNLI